MPLYLNTPPFQKQLIIIDIPVYICKLHVSLIMFVIKYVYGDIITIIVLFRQKLYSLSPKQGQ